MQRCQNNDPRKTQQKSGKSGTPGHSVNDIRLIPLELIHTNRDSVRKAREAHLIDKAKTLEPQGLNRRDELH